jgi:FecR protein
MHVTARRLVLVVGLAMFLASPSLAQTALAHLSQIEGTVTRLHRFAPAPVSVGVALVERDQIVTAVGRAEVTFADGSVMHLDQHTQVVIAGAARVRLLDGRVSLRTTTPYTAETGSGIVHVLPEGRYELTASANNRDVLLRVVEGHAPIPRSETGELRRDLAVATFGRAGAPPFLPYAHPAYRQFDYERLLRKGRHDRKRPELHQRVDVGRDAPQRDNAPVQRRTSRTTTDGDRRRSDRPAPAAKGAAPAARGAGKGAAVRRP